MTHFVEDLVHYDSGFWKTIKLLILKPGFVIREYLAGKRKSFVPPVKFYIFISFVAFLIPFILPNTKKKEKSKTEQTQNQELSASQKDSLVLSVQQNEYIPDNIKGSIVEEIESDTNSSSSNAISFNEFSTGGYKSKAELDSVYQNLIPGRHAGWFEYKAHSKLFEWESKSYSSEEFSKKVIDIFVHSISKALFVFMPIFAFVLWLFHNKKRWYFYDHGVFTLYYFSTILIVVTSAILITWLLNLFGPNSFINTTKDILYWICGLFILFAYLKSQRVVYQTSRSQTIMKGIALFFVNFILILIGILVLLLFTLNSI
ncbi:DUF3667 domain-containing protein [Sphingobacterium hungaricum]|nr:DUF3667 domain-containing protein [Sphingobacterium hungaricum]